MKKITKAISFVLCLSLLVNVAWLEVSASPSKTAGSNEEIRQQTNGGGDDLPDAGKKGTDSIGKDGAGTSQEEKEGDEGVAGENAGSIDDETFSPQENYIENLQIVRKEEHAATIAWDVIDEQVVDGCDVAVYEDLECEIPAEGIEVSEGETDTEVILSGLETDKVYYAVVAAYCLDGEEKILSEESAKLEIKAGPAAPVQLMDTAPEVITVNVVDGDTKAQISWTWDIPGGKTVAAYQIYDGSGNKVRDIAAAETGCAFTGLRNGQRYTYSLKAVEIEDDGTESVLGESALFILAPRAAVPTAVTGLTASSGEDFIVLSWGAAGGATSYYVECFLDNRWVRIAEVNGTSFTHDNLAAATTYQYRVYSVRTSGGQTVCGSVSEVASAQVPENAGEAHGMCFNAKTRSKTKVYSAKTGGTVIATLKKGTRMVVTDNGGKRYEVKLPTGQIGWVQKSKVKLTGSVVSKVDYTTKVKTAFVNSRGYSSKTPYLIWLNHYTQRTYIYYGSKGNWQLIRTCRISSGKHNMQTPKGVFKIIKKTNGWKKKSYYVKPAVSFRPGIWFHSRLKKYNGGMYDGTIGRPASHGCVRMYDEDINFMYQQMPKKTTVVSF